MLNKGSLFIISAPSGGGKTSLVKALIQEIGRVCISVSYTTRPMRPREQDGIDYYFISKEEFKHKIEEGVFLEHAEVFGNFYGTSRVLVEDLQKQGFDVILEIDWQGALQVRQKIPETTSIFILPLSVDILAERLSKRHPNHRIMVEERMQEAKNHMVHYHEYDYVIFNDTFDEALADLSAIIRTHRLRLARQQAVKQEILKKLLS
jgi:guanylate kinase